MPRLEENYNRLLDRIGEAALRSGRKPEDVRLLGVTKRVEAARILEVIELGLTDIGENRVQEAEDKMPRLGGSGVRCHLIGHLQANKARRALELCHSIQSLDSPRLALRLDGMLERRFPVFIQVKTVEEATKSGVAPSELAELVDVVRRSRWLDLEGFMTIPPFREDPDQVRPYFRRIRELGAEYGVTGLSIGMSHDFEAAIEEGATHVRVGSALFGTRE